MKKLILEIQVSVDGYMAGIQGNTDWMIWNWGPNWTWDQELQTYHTALTKSADRILLSRQMAEEGFIAHWANTAEDQRGSQYEFARHISQCPKTVFTKTLTQSNVIPGGWNNVQIASGDLVDEITTLKKQEGKNILVYGGSTFVSSLIEKSLVDEFHLLVNPVALGKGLPVFHGQETQKNLSLVKSRSFDCGVVLLHYMLKKG